MAHDITVPRLGWTMEEGTFGGWLKGDGDTVREGDELFVLESDKASEAVTALDAGILRIGPGGPRQGDTVRVGQLLGHVLVPGEAAPAPEVAAPTPAAPAPAAAVSHSATATRRRQAVSPRARRVARALGVDWSHLTGSGRTGRVVERDVRAAAAQAQTADRVLPLSPVRRLIAERMAASARATAPVTLTTKADATGLKEFRQRRKAAGGPVPGYTEMILLLAAKALERHPQLNARWQGDSLALCASVHVGVAVDTEAGLVVPVLRDANRLGLDEASALLRDLADRARRRRLGPDEMQGGTFTVTNLGMYGIDAFTPIVNLPECAVLGVGRVVTEPAVRGGKIEPRDLLTLSLTFDHRAVDGAPAARFLDEVRRNIEQAPNGLTGG